MEHVEGTVFDPVGDSAWGSSPVDSTTFRQRVFVIGMPRQCASRGDDSLSAGVALPPRFPRRRSLERSTEMPSDANGTSDPRVQF